MKLRSGGPPPDHASFFAPSRKRPAVGDVEDAPEAARRARARAVGYELRANNGYYSKRVCVATREPSTEPHALYFLELSLGDHDQARMFRPVDDARGEALEAGLITRARFSAGHAVGCRARLPVHWEEKKVLEARFPDLQFSTDGEVYRGASPRSLFVGWSNGQVPSRLPELERHSIKLHLSDEAYARLGGLGGHRDINANDAWMAVVLTHVLEELRPRLSPYFDFQPERRAMAVRVGSGSEALEVGAIFRELDTRPLVPGFALFSPTEERLPHSAPRAVGSPRLLAADAMHRLARLRPELDRATQFLLLFVDPLFDVAFSLAREGLSAELHPQNFLLEFDPKSALPRRVVLRDVHGVCVDDAWRSARGLEPMLAPERLAATIPGSSQADVDAYLKRGGEIRDRYRYTNMVATMLDFHASIFLYQVISGLYGVRMFSRAQVDELVEAIRDRMEHLAARHGFERDALPPPRSPLSDFWTAYEDGIRGRLLFRRPPQIPVPEPSTITPSPIKGA